MDWTSTSRGHYRHLAFFSSISLSSDIVSPIGLVLHLALLLVGGSMVGAATMEGGVKAGEEIIRRGAGAGGIIAFF